MWRDGPSAPLYWGPDEQAAIRCGRAVIGLCAELDEIFQFIEPRQEHDQVYGPRLQRLLFAACSEVETSWSGILHANGYPDINRWTTNDYVKLEEALGLSAYSMRLEAAVGYPSIEPFTGWDHRDPTKSIQWYDAYNKVKHNNEINARLATLKNVISACSAVFGLAIAQYGPELFNRDGRFYQPVLWFNSYFAFQREHAYRGTPGGGDLQPVPYFT
jgi:hypothetical protein